MSKKASVPVVASVTSEPVVVELSAHGTAGEFVGPLASIASCVQAQPDSIRKSALAAVTTAEAEIQAVENASGPRYATVIRAVMHCLAIHLTRKEIAGAVEMAAHPSEAPVRVTRFTGGRQETAVGKPGRIARYVKIAQWEMGLYADSEIRPPHGVVIMGETYRSPVVALESGKHNFTAVYQAWRNATADSFDIAGLYTQVDASAEAAIAEFRVKVRVREGETERRSSIKVVEDTRAVWGALRGLCKHGKAADKLSYAKRKALGELLGLVVESDAVEETEETETV